jgi:glycosyltransferase involved in cell wall biosynthesis
VHLPSQHFARYGLLLRRPLIVTVHDLVRMCFPVDRETIRERVGLRLDALGLKRAQHIIAVSACTRRDLVRYLNIPEDRISVIHNGVDRQVFRVVVGRRFPFPYVLYVGSERPRKNLGSLLAAFAFLKRNDSSFADVKLVKVGTPGRTDQFRQATLTEVGQLGLEGEVIFVDYISDHDLAACYSSALALVMPSLYEGFGLTLIEAMACGCPVIASNCSSLPEVARDAALFFTPNDNLELAGLMRRVVTEGQLRAELVRKGFDRVRLFSWEKAAQETLQVYSRVEAKPGLRQLQAEALRGAIGR